MDTESVQAGAASSIFFSFSSLPTSLFLSLSLSEAAVQGLPSSSSLHPPPLTAEAACLVCSNKYIDECNAAHDMEKCVEGKEGEHWQTR